MRERKEAKKQPKTAFLPLHQKIERARQDAEAAVEPGQTWKGRLPMGSVAQIEIRHYMATTNLLIPKGRFHKAVKDVCRQISKEKRDEWEKGAKEVDGWEPPMLYRMETQGLLALQEATETLITAMMEECNYAAIHAKRVTIMPKDHILVSRLRGTWAQNPGARWKSFGQCEAMHGLCTDSARESGCWSVLTFRGRGRKNWP